ncbi:hypothetical protein [Kangiella sp.]|uniref:hypothetical protein n=1 Tax=Kangiella sp. TaxID=1920245 RepID=UPI00199E5990|nr:hypothetical protein [Kangiella sp.]MBD3653403.1 hypothetical protein [Kangiella sp.]
MRFLILLVSALFFGNSADAKEIVHGNLTITVPEYAELNKEGVDEQGNIFHVYSLGLGKLLMLRQSPPGFEYDPESGRLIYHTMRIKELNDNYGFISHSNSKVSNCNMDVYQYKTTDNIEGEPFIYYTSDYIIYCSDKMSMVSYSDTSKHTFKAYNDLLATMKIK